VLSMRPVRLHKAIISISFLVTFRGCASPVDGRHLYIVLLAADGVPNVQIAEQVAASRPTVNLWRAWYATTGIAGLDDPPKAWPAADGRSESNPCHHDDAAADPAWHALIVAAVAGYLMVDAWMVLRTWRRGRSRGG